ncbi:hypothetical protein AB0O22_39400 [Streptomyces sp. NPDC091204]
MISIRIAQTAAVIALALSAATLVFGSAAPTGISAAPAAAVSGSLGWG